MMTLRMITRNFNRKHCGMVLNAAKFCAMSDSLNSARCLGYT